MGSIHPSVAVVGGGLSGLIAAHVLRGSGAQVTVYESSPRAGGVIGTHRERGYLAETGPQSVQSTPALSALIGELGLAADVVRASIDDRARCVVHNGRLVPVPQTPAGFLGTSLLSWRAKARALREPWISPAAGGQDESLAAFVRRRFGTEVPDWAVDPVVTEAYAGDPERLSVAHAFPELAALERDHGSLLRGAAHARRAAGREASREAPLSFRGGLSTLVDALSQSLGNALQTATPVTGVSRSAGGWMVAARGPAGSARRSVDAVLYAGPAHAVRAIAWPDSVLRLCAPLAAIAYPPLAVVTLGFRREQVTDALAGPGVLVPDRESCAILGALFTSTLFPNRAPAGKATIACFVGGARRPALAEATTDTVRAAVISDLQRLLGVRGEPTFVHHIAWPHAIPQYELGHGAVRQAIGALEAAHPGLYFAGSYVGGVSVGDCIVSARTAARRIIAECELDQRLTTPDAATAGRPVLADTYQPFIPSWPSFPSTSSPSPPTATTSS